MNHASSMNVFIPTTSFIDILPICNSSFVRNTRKSAAIRERPLADRSHAVGDCYARKSAAIRERPLADRSHAVRDCYARKSAAIIERPISDRSHTAIRRYNARFTTNY